MKHIFISYKRENIDFIDKIVEKLEVAKMPVWADVKKLRASEDWSEKIETAIQEAAAVVVVITPQAMKSEYITYEWSFALGRGIPVVPLMVTKTDSYHPRLMKIQFLDFTIEASRPWEKLQQTLKEIIEQPQPADLVALQAELEHFKAMANQRHLSLLGVLADLRLSETLSQRHLNVFFNMNLLTEDDLRRIQEKIYENKLQKP